jgi:lipoprotein signal peptidase
MVNNQFVFGLVGTNLIAILISIFIIIALIIFFLFQQKKYSLWILLLFTGAISILIDRLIYGGAVDYFPVYFFKTNLADIVLSIGIFMFFYLLIDKKTQS